MDYTYLGRTGTSVSRIVLGTMNFGDRTLHQPGVTGPIIGPRTVAQLESAVGAPAITLTEEDLSALDDLFPGPGGQAPEAHAW